MQFRTKLDENMQKELIRVPRIFAIVISVLGFVGIVFTVSVIVFTGSEDIQFLEYFFAAIFAMGLVLIFTYGRIIKNFSKINKENEYTIYDEYMEIKTYYHGEVEATCKLYYSDAFKIRESKRYIFVYQDNMRAFPMEKANVPDLERLKEVLKLK